MSCMSATDGRERARHEEGTAIILALVATVLLSALGVGLVLMSNTETAIAATVESASAVNFFMKVPSLGIG